MNKQLAARIARIVNPPTFEIEAKRNARFGRLNIARGYDVEAHIAVIEKRGDVRQEFARRLAAGAL